MIDEENLFFFWALNFRLSCKMTKVETVNDIVKQICSVFEFGNW